jgi:hypothetical protein
MRDKIIIYKKWLEMCEDLSIEEKKIVYYWIVRNSAFDEMPPTIENERIQQKLNLILPLIKKAKDDSCFLSKKGKT